MPLRCPKPDAGGRHCVQKSATAIGRILERFLCAIGTQFPTPVIVGSQENESRTS